ncbi:MAG: iron-sulfur cluster-binding protein [Deltaproteobacteria bacterium]|nr:iron-sulfur cluster-binding protein [Deltaproteobacteria bacterium]MBT4262886.1 iron-sulfur cluster-binding protein [Deltaproteobacteria bacterium]MBT4644201.1 iron-sulfur cluster-binding protein [Deltaproteobacteria bacterium]MBT7155919.1 iron-sulfur cluster-binding protein [Deltaproteobacteria bacterium]MBT7711356.1 iron-sulfur cluster-binding protein [Deltaproteobacteria bacterium]
MTTISTEHYKNKAKEAIKDDVLQSALAGLQNRLGPATAAMYKNLPEGDELRYKAHEVRMFALDNLDMLLEQLAQKIRQRGGNVFFARDQKEAVNYCLEITRRRKAKLAVKGKSMVSEEIGLNDALIKDGVKAVETDLGEYIVQLAGEHPSHIIAPAIHKTRNQIGSLFEEKLGISYTNDPPTLTKAARKHLRDAFLTADIGFSGCNLACAETGHITTLSNEGNIRLATTLPKVHVAIMGMERIVASLEDHDALFRLLSRGAAAQNLAGYVSYIGGPALDSEIDGPEEFHLVILDNGRSKILADEEFKEILCCIRCAACLNVCPVYGKIGGHSYGCTYTGPIGAVLTPLMTDIGQSKDLFQGESLCGACQDNCPVNINLPRMLLALRAKTAEGDPRWNIKPSSPVEKFIFSIWSKLISNRKAYDFFFRLARFGQKILPTKNGEIRKLPPPFSGWTLDRDMQQIASKSFIQKWKETQK